MTTEICLVYHLWTPLMSGDAPCAAVRTSYAKSDAANTGIIPGPNPDE